MVEWDLKVDSMMTEGTGVIEPVQEVSEEIYIDVRKEVEEDVFG